MFIMHLDPIWSMEFIFSENIVLHLIIYLGCWSLRNTWCWFQWRKEEINYISLTLFSTENGQLAYEIICLNLGYFPALSKFHALLETKYPVTSLLMSFVRSCLWYAIRLIQRLWSRSIETAKFWLFIAFKPFFASTGHASFSSFPSMKIIVFGSDTFLSLNSNNCHNFVVDVVCLTIFIYIHGRSHTLSRPIFISWPF
jgi:hypothetical protein